MAAPCNPTALAVGLDALDSAPDEQLPRLIAADLLDACTFDAPTQDALAAVSRGQSPTDEDLLELPLFHELCPSGSKPTPAALWRRCELARLGIFTREDWLAGSGPPVLALVVYATLVDQGLDPDTAQIVTRRLAGVPRTSRSRVIDVFEPLFPTFP